MKAFVIDSRNFLVASVSFAPWMLCLFAFLIGLLATSLFAQDSKATAKQAAQPAPASSIPYLLRHKMRAGEEIRSTVTHQAKTTTRIQGEDQASTARTVSEKVWKVTGISKSGEMTFEYRIDRVEMTQQNGDQPPMNYDSSKDKEAPAIYSKVAGMVGKPISTVVVNARGQVLKRSDSNDAPDLGMGDIILPFPEEAIAIGGTWSVPRDTRVKLRDGTHKTIKIREQYELLKVQSGVATLAVRSQPLTPLEGPEVESQVMQQLSNGELRFDMEKGRMLSKELNWDDSVVGFSGAESQLTYSARYREELQAPKVAARPAAKQKNRK